jgi:phosphohistidine phosphatase
MLLYLVRHGQANLADKDPKKCLSKKGREEVLKTALFLVEHVKNKISRIVHSGKCRAKETAEIIGERLNPSKGIEETDHLNPLDEPTIWQERIETEKEDLMLVGHLPYLSKLTSLLLYKNENIQQIEFQAASVLCLKREENKSWCVLWMVSPETL